MLIYSYVYYSSNSNIMLLYYRYYLGYQNCKYFFFSCNPNILQNPNTFHFYSDR